MNRRETVLALLALGAAQLARAQPVGRLPRVGLLSFAAAAEEFPEKPTIDSLRELGWIEGVNVAIEYRYAGGDPAKLAQYAAELVRAKVDLIITFSAGVGAAKKATSTIPIVFGTSQNPVGMAYIASLARPGNNLTGVAYLTDELSAKRLALAKEMLPRLSRAAVLWEPMHLDNEYKGMLAAAPALGVRLQSLEIPRPARSDEIEIAVRAANAAKSEVLLLAPGGFTIAQRKKIIAVASKASLPVISAWSIFADEGALLTYGPDLPEVCRRIASHADRILKGERSENLPVEGPTKFEMVVNLKTAKTLGIRVPNSILVQASRRIE
jgi:putative ABC transport system substrate-binding protein